MYMKHNIYSLFLLVPIFSFSQENSYLMDYAWDENPSYEVTNSEEPMISVKDKYVVEFVYTDEKNLTEYYMEHQVLWLNSDDKIEAYNKIYLPYSSSSELLVSKARVITKAGEIIELDSSKILTAEDKETGKKYKYFLLKV